MDDDDHLSKRRTTQHPPPPPPSSDLISQDLNARLQNVASRIRRSVSEGYATHRFSPTSTQSHTQGSINDAAIFRSSNDTLHAVYSQFTSSTIVPSDRKRGRMESTVDERDEHPDGGSIVQESASVITTNDLACSRPIKSLRRTPRAFGQTRSLPAAVFASSRGGEDQTSLDAGIQEEEDWSAAAFSGDSSKAQSLT